MQIASRNKLFRITAISAAILAWWPGLSAAAEVRSVEEMMAQVRQNLPDFLKDPADVVNQMLNVELATPLSKSFNPNAAIKAVFGDGSVNVATDCRRRATPVGDPDQGDCTVQSGNMAGKGQFLLLQYSKNMGNGNIKHLKRPPVDDSMTTDKLPRARMTDAEAMEAARKFLAEAFGLGMEEVPLPPAGAKSSMVRNLAMVGTDDRGALAQPIVTQKHVFWQRGWKLGKAYGGPDSMELTHVPGPGMAMVAMDDSGIVGARVMEWQELRKDPKMTADLAKSTDELIEEIAEDLFGNGVRNFDRLNFGLHIASDWRGTFGLLLPAVQVSVNAVPADLSEDDQAKYAGKTTAGLIRNYPLVHRLETDSRAQ